MKLYVQNFHPAWAASAPLTASATSGSFVTEGYARLLGMIITCTSTVAGSGLLVYQSNDYGQNWDYVHPGSALSACSGSVFDLPIYGNAAKIEFRPDTTASIFRTLWQLRPV